MPAPMIRLGRCVLIVAMFFAIGGHWLVLQTVPWGGMIVDYSRAAGLTAAVEKTFDGQHPCGMCKSITETRKSEKKGDSFVVIKKVEMFQQKAAPWFAPVVVAWEEPLTDTTGVVRAEAPSIPPPRKA